MIAAIAESGKAQDDACGMRLRLAALPDEAITRLLAERPRFWRFLARGFESEPEVDAALCRCCERILPVLKPRHAELIWRVDLRGELKVIVALDLKLTRGALDVALHRARRALREKLELFCVARGKDGGLQCVDEAAKSPDAQEKA